MLGKYYSQFIKARIQICTVGLDAQTHIILTV